MDAMQIEISIGIVSGKTIFSFYSWGNLLKRLEYDGKNIVRDCEMAGKSYGLKLRGEQLSEYHLINGKRINSKHIPKEGIESFVKSLNDVLKN